MADYAAPFHMPTFSDQEYLDKKAKYVAENGYTVTFPRFGDIIHVPIIPRMTDQEKGLWYSGRRKEIAPRRQQQLSFIKERNRERYNRMMASPTPNWVSSYTSILTALDDAQDALITLAAIGRIAIKFIPRFLSRFLMGPVAWLWLISSLMSLLMAPSMCALTPLKCKREMKKKLARRRKSLSARVRTPEKFTKAWYRMQKEKLKRGYKGYAKSGGFLPSFAEGIQVLQVTDGIYGYGLAIGPIFGLAYDLIAGSVRWSMGQKVSFKNAPSDVEIYQRVADKKNNYARWKRPKEKMSRDQFLNWKHDKIRAGTWGVRSQQDDLVQKAMKQHSTYGGVLRRTDYLEETLFYIGNQLASQGIKNVLDYWDPTYEVEGLEHIEVEAYCEPNPLIEEMLREEGVDPEAGIAWPSTGTRWATYEDISRTTAPVAAANFAHFSDTCPDERLKIIGEISAIEGALHSISMIEEEGLVDIQYHAAITITETLLDHGYSFPKTITEDQIYKFGYWCLDQEEVGQQPTLREILHFADINCGFEFTTTPGAR